MSRAETSMHKSTPPSPPAGLSKAVKPQAVLEVMSAETLSPRMRRIVMGGPGIDTLSFNTHADSYVKLLLPEPGSGLVPPFDLEALRANTPELLPRKRTYTVRRWDEHPRTITLDFVIHNDEGHTGIASDWAQKAQPGDLVAVMGAGGAYTPQPETQFHLLIGDHATVPAIATALERMQDDARGIAVIHLEHEEDALPLEAPEGVEVRWIVGERNFLLEEVQEIDIPAEAIGVRSVQVFCHAERELTKHLRRHLVQERGIERADISISAYWAFGRVEDQFQAEKREAIGKIDPE